MNLLKSLFISAVCFTLNEYIFYLSNASYFVNFIILLLPLFLSKKYGLQYSLFITLIFSALLLGARPREIHLIPLEFRGFYEYYSYHSQKLFLFSFSTTTLLFYSFFIFLRKKIVWKKNKYFSVAIIVFFVSQIVGLLSDKILLQFIISDLKWLFAFIIGLNITFGKKEKTLLEKHLTILMYSTIIITFFSLFSDFLQDDFKLKFSINFIYIIPVVGFFLLIKSKKSSLFLLNIPITTTDIFLYIGLIFTKLRIKLMVLLSSVIIVIVVVIVTPIDNVKSDTFIGFLLRETKVSTDLSLDKSILVRAYEFRSFLNGSGFNILFGKGFGGYFTLDDFPLDLDLSDFSQFELNTMKFNQPHTFFTYLLMKFGLIGFLFITYFTFKFSYGSYIFRVIFTISILSSFYWIPLLAFIWGSYISIKNQHEKIPNSRRAILQ